MMKSSGIIFFSIPTSPFWDMYQLSQLAGNFEGARGIRKKMALLFTIIFISNLVSNVFKTFCGIPRHHKPTVILHKDSITKEKASCSVVWTNQWHFDAPRIPCIIEGMYCVVLWSIKGNWISVYLLYLLYLDYANINKRRRAYM